MASSSTEFPKAKPTLKGGRFDNPWDTWSDEHFNAKGLWAFKRAENNTGLPSNEELNETLPVRAPDFTPPSSGQLKATWLGHATVVVQSEKMTLMTDPIFSKRCSPLFFAGPLRFRPPPCTAEDLPKIDLVVISHSHYDHLDKQTVKDIAKYQQQSYGETPSFFVPLGLKDWLLSLGCFDEAKVEEMNWWDEKRLGDQVKIFCTPAQHWSARSPFDRNKTLWSSWVVELQGQKFFFAGDTGYFPQFPSIAHHCGPIHLAAIPLGCYEPNWFMKAQHIGPAEAVKIHQELKSQYSIGIHWGTYDMGSKEPYLEPKTKLVEEIKRLGVAAAPFVTLQHGESCVV